LAESKSLAKSRGSPWASRERHKVALEHRSGVVATKERTDGKSTRHDRDG
jgi:hypothetical protein